MSLKGRPKAFALKKEYARWRDNNFVLRKGFFPVFQDFKMILPHISPGAVALYLYLGMGSDRTGESFHSVEKISEYFQKSSRTISNWIKELEEIGLIERMQFKANDVSHTYLKPYPETSQIEKYVIEKYGKFKTQEPDEISR